MKRTIVIKNQQQELARVTEFVEEVCEDLEIDMRTMMKIQLAMEETVSNVILYAYPAESREDITIMAESDEKMLAFVITDRGEPFDPTVNEKADTETNPMDREQGGMGIFIVKNIMDEVSYCRIDNTNRLTMKKKL